MVLVKGLQQWWWQQENENTVVITVCFFCTRTALSALLSQIPRKRVLSGWQGSPDQEGVWPGTQELFCTGWEDSVTRARSNEKKAKNKKSKFRWSLTFLFLLNLVLRGHFISSKEIFSIYQLSNFLNAIVHPCCDCWGLSLAVCARSHPRHHSWAATVEVGIMTLGKLKN